MPIVTVTDLHPERYRELKPTHYLQCDEEIQKCFADIPELKLKETDAIVKFEHSYGIDHIYDHTNIITANVYGLVDKPERTKEVRQKLAEAIRNAIKAHCRTDFKRIIVFVPVFDEEQGGLAGIGED